MDKNSSESMVCGIRKFFIERKSSYSRLPLRKCHPQNAFLLFNAKSKVMNKGKNNKQPNELSIPIINQNAAGIDVGDLLLSVAVPPGRDDVSVKEFGAFTEDLHAIAQWLKKCSIDSIAMECTGGQYGT
jgi:hypothetical protein